METTFDLHEKPELKKLYKECMTKYVETIKENFSNEDVYIIAFGTESQTMYDTYTCMTYFNTEEDFEILKKSRGWESYFEYCDEDSGEEERYWYFRVNEHEWDYRLDVELCDEIFKPVRDYLTDYFEKFVASLEDEDDFENWLVDKEVCNSASFAFEELREEGVFKNSQGKEMIVKLLGFDRFFEEDEYIEMFERANKNVPLKDKYLESILYNEINLD